MLLSTRTSSMQLGTFMSATQEQAATMLRTSLQSHSVGWPEEPPAQFHLRRGRRGSGKCLEEV